MAEAIQMAEHGHARVVGHAFGQAAAATGHQQVQ